jgi:hypothetical protein
LVKLRKQAGNIALYIGFEILFVPDFIETIGTLQPRLRITAPKLNVTSLPNFDGSEYLVIQSQPGTFLSNVSTADTDTLGTPPAGVSFPLGALQFNVGGIAPGAASVVSRFRSYIRSV